MSALSLLILATAALCVGFGVLYLVARRLDNYGIVDVAWALAFSLLAGFYAMGGTGWLERRWLVAALAAGWSLRLGMHLLLRVASHHPVEDRRYVQLRRDWAGVFAPKMAGFFQLQALSVVFLGIVFLVPVQNPVPGWHGLEIAGVVLWLVAVGGEAVADAQLAAFKRDPANRGQVCTVGLWRYSRHPNYFFEWLVWVAFCLVALGSPWGWVTLAAPATLLYLLLRVTGIPLTEEQAVRSKGDAYRRYQQTTSTFFPWRPAKLPRPSLSP
ncbi:MAG: DUF1295 domain-containing protein [Verrucomicrobia bacterium]|nr:DUF1295 domain-containing protein [Verrucomicrobiota bacterium]